MSTRTERLERLRTEKTWDVVVIGGGATGLGTAVDAATRGYSTLLIEAHDFAKGTSSRSTKLIHGGVRYLAQGQVGLVREALRERGLLLRNAPHLVNDLSLLIPAYRWWDRPYYGLGLWMYDRLAGSLGMGSSHAIASNEALKLAPTLEPQGLRGGVVYHDGQFDDARLAIALSRTIDDHGGTAINAVGITGFEKNGSGRIIALRARDSETGEEFHIKANGVVNATGVFVDAIRRLDEPASKAMIAPSQGAHIVLDRAFLPGETAILVPKTDDGRVLFAIPWHDRVIVGTTDTPVDRTALEPHALRNELEFLLTHARRYLAKDPTERDVLSVFAGLRPLIAQAGAGQLTSKLSREYAAIVSDSGLVTVTGGKWTTYRRMGEAAVDLVAKVADLPTRPCKTANLSLHGATPDAQTSQVEFASYGADASKLAALIAERPEWQEPLHERLPYRAGEVVWAARYESARTVEDVLARRTRTLFLDARAAIEVAPFVAQLLANELSYDANWQYRQVRAFSDLASGYLIENLLT